MEQSIKQEDFIIDPELECAICSDILFHPVSINCGHSFCKNCLLTALTSKPQCPLCKTPCLIQEKSLKENVTLKSIVENKYPEYIKKKEKQNPTEDKSKNLEEIKEEDVPFNPLLILPTIKEDYMLLFPNTKATFDVRIKFSEAILFNISYDRKILAVPDSVIQNELPFVTFILQLNKMQKKHNDIYTIEVDVLDRVMLQRVNNLDLDQQYLDSLQLPSDQPITLNLGYGHMLKDKPIGTLQQIQDQVEMIEEYLNTKLNTLLMYAPGHANVLVNLMAPLLRDSQFRSLNNFINFSFGLAKIIKTTKEEKRRMIETTNTLERLFLLKSILDKHENSDDFVGAFDIEVPGHKLFANPRNSLIILLLLLLMGWFVKVTKLFR